MVMILFGGARAERKIIVASKMTRATTSVHNQCIYVIQTQMQLRDDTLGGQLPRKMHRCGLELMSNRESLFTRKTYAFFLIMIKVIATCV